MDSDLATGAQQWADELSISGWTGEPINPIATYTEWLFFYDESKVSLRRVMVRFENRFKYEHLTPITSSIRTQERNFF